MTLNPQAIAVSGYGFGPQLIAVSGYGEVISGIIADFIIFARRRERR